MLGVVGVGGISEGVLGVVGVGGISEGVAGVGGVGGISEGVAGVGGVGGTVGFCEFVTVNPFAASPAIPTVKPSTVTSSIP